MTWLYVALSTALMLCLGIVYSYSLFRLEIESIYQIGETLSSLPYMLVLLFYAISMALSGVLFDKYSTLKLSLIGVFLISIGFILSSFAQNIWLLSLYYGLFIGIGIGILYTLPLRVVASLHHKHPGLLTGITLMGFGLSPLVFAPIIEDLITGLGLSNTFMILGFTYLGLLTVFTLLLYKHDTKEKVKHQIDFSVLKNKNFYLIYFLFFIGTFIGLTIIGFSANIGTRLISLNLNQMAILIGVFSIFNALGRPLYGYLNDKLGFGIPASLSFLLSLIAAFVANLFPLNIYAFIFSFIIFYLNFGGWLGLAPAATIDYFGKNNYSKTYGFIFTAYGLAAFVGNLLSSTVISVFSYQGMYLFIAGFALIGFISVISLIKKSA